ncbi:50S ribosomal protein L3 N(5)-glutamine methyltransferase [Halomonas elongata]|uniref:50S ribosomal protein L3 N(5)-glutamine methyltransferase n=1 Tax=Halomonas elongata TaxID=2746 RepID=UPI0023B03306|nr:50S ribosomal protein L3 N(5)-glutamine methyltransferase [Halomonas elongata]
MQPPTGSLVAESVCSSSTSTLALDDAEIAEGLISLRDCLRWATSEFHLAGLHYGHGTDSAWDEAVALTLGALHLPWNVDPGVLDARLLPVERRRIVGLVRERIGSRRPLPYLLGEAFFAGVPFNVDERVLIPRSPIAELIEHGFGAWFPVEPPARVLDLCTGSGCIGIATALHLPTCEVDLADVSADALTVARQNVNRHDVGDRVQAVASDVFDGLEGRRYDLIVANPPYVDARDLATMPAEFRHEPGLALGAGADGLDIVRRILRQSREHLTDDGVLIVEVGNSDHHLEAAFPEVPFLWLEFERGGQGVFALTAAELDAHAASFA